MTLYYILDPMCSWCWAFRPSWAALRAALPADIDVQYVMGGLAADSDAPMPPAMQQHLQAAWHRVAAHTGAEFNFAFWERCQPRRSTWPACRAVIAAGRQDAAAIPTMIEAIQQAYYHDARNPSDIDTLVDIAAGVGLNGERLRADLDSIEVHRQFAADRELAAEFGIDGFPSVVARHGAGVDYVAVGYCDAATLLERWQAVTHRLAGAAHSA